LYSGLIGLRKGVANLLRVSNCGLVAGKVEVFFNNPNQPTAVELYDNVTFNSRNMLRRKEICNGKFFTLKSY